MFKAFSLIKTNFLSIIIFEILYKILSGVVIGAVGTGFFNLILLASGASYLAPDTGKQILLNPLTWILGIIFLLFLVYVTMVEILGVIVAIDESANGRKMPLSAIFNTAFSKALAAMRLKNIGLFIFVLLILPFTQLIPLAGVVNSITIPGFIMDFINANRVLSIVIPIVFLALAVFAIKRIFVIPSFSLRGGDFKENVKTAGVLIKKNFFKTLFGFIFFEIVLGLIVLAIFFIATGIAIPIINGTVPEVLRHDAALNVVNNINLIVFGIFGLFAPFLGFLRIVDMYYKSCKKKDVEPAVSHSDYEKLTGGKKAAFVIVSAAIVAAAVVLGISNPESIRSLDASSVVVAAHRGASIDTPENSMAAFEKAIELKADQIELDVHQTKDGVVVVTHDANIKRIAGVDKNVYDLTLAEIKSYDVGSWFDPKFSYLRVATLEEVLELCKGKIDLQIEIKPTGNEPDFEQHVIDVVRKHGFEKNCVLGSLNAETLKKCKELAPDIETLYIMVTASGKLQDNTFADAFSIEETNVDPGMIRGIHDAGKSCYVWTINKDDNIANLLDASIDGIVTDDVVLIQKALLRGGKNPLIVSFVDAIYGVDTYAPLYEKDPYDTP